jgi:hypothetical protein
MSHPPDETWFPGVPLFGALCLMSLVRWAASCIRHLAPVANITSRAKVYRTNAMLRSSIELRDSKMSLGEHPTHSICIDFESFHVTSIACSCLSTRTLFSSYNFLLCVGCTFTASTSDVAAPQFLSTVVTVHLPFKERASLIVSVEHRSHPQSNEAITNKDKSFILCLQSIKDILTLHSCNH